MIAKGIIEIINIIGPPITAFHVNVEKIFNNTSISTDCPTRGGC